MKKNFYLFLTICVTCFLSACEDMVVTTGDKLSIYAEPNDSWSSIGADYGMTDEEIAAFNGKTIDYVIQVGEEIKVPQQIHIQSEDIVPPAYEEPKAPSYTIITVKEDSTLNDLAIEYDTSLQGLAYANPDLIIPAGTKIRIND